MDEPDLDPSLAAKGAELTDNLTKETFFRNIAAIEQAATAIQSEYKKRYDDALDGRVRPTRRPSILCSAHRVGRG